MSENAIELEGYQSFTQPVFISNIFQDHLDAIDKYRKQIVEHANAIGVGVIETWHKDFKVSFTTSNEVEVGSIRTIYEMENK